MDRPKFWLNLLPPGVFPLSLCSCLHSSTQYLQAVPHVLRDNIDAVGQSLLTQSTSDSLLLAARTHTSCLNYARPMMSMNRPAIAPSLTQCVPIPLDYRRSSLCYCAVACYWCMVTHDEVTLPTAVRCSPLTEARSMIDRPERFSATHWCVVNGRSAGKVSPCPNSK